MSWTRQTWLRRLQAICELDVCKAQTGMRKSVRDLAHAGIYFCVVAALIIVAAFSAASSIPSIVSVIVSSSADADEQPTRLSVAVANAREIRDALEKPIPGPPPLQPITAKLAYGHLKPGGNGDGATAKQLPKIPKRALDAWAMDTGEFRTRSVKPPELHKVY